MRKSERESIIFPHLSKNQCANSKDKEPMPMSSYDFSIWSTFGACTYTIKVHHSLATREFVLQYDQETRMWNFIQSNHQAKMRNHLKIVFLFF